MSTKTETENIKTSGAEKVLAAVLAVFILIGAVWTYDQIGHISKNDGGYQSFVQAKSDLSPTDRAARSELSRARSDIRRSQRSVNKQTSKVEFTRETYRAEVDAGRAAPVELAEYRQAQAELVAAQQAENQARNRYEAAKPAANVANRNLNANEAELRDDGRFDDTIVFILRLVLLAAMLGGGYLGLSAVRRRRSRLLPLVLAEIGAATGLAIYMAGDYGSELGIFDEAGPFLISIIGIILTVIAFIALQRYLAKRVPLRRVRRQECPFCGYPTHGNPQCEGCGRRVVGECSTCHQPRRVASPHCGQCGAA